MNLFGRKMPLFCVSNIMVSFICTGLVGTTYAVPVTETEQGNLQEVVASSDVDPLSQKGEKENDLTKPVVEEKKEVVNTKQVTKTATKKTTKTTSVVTKKEVKATKTYTPAKYNEVTGNAVVEYAKKYLGLRYVSAGRSLATGTDCSGFTSLIYREFGVKLGYTVSSQINSGKYVQKRDLQKGDLVFYSKGGSKATHVAMYIGNNQVIHESTYKYGVKISSVNMMHYITARRVINDTANKIVEEKIKAEENKENVNTTNTVEEALPTNNNESSSTNAETNTTVISNQENTAVATNETTNKEENTASNVTQNETKTEEVPKDNNAGSNIMDNKKESSSNESESTTTNVSNDVSKEENQ